MIDSKKRLKIRHNTRIKLFDFCFFLFFESFSRNSVTIESIFYRRSKCNSLNKFNQLSVRYYFVRIIFRPLRQDSISIPTSWHSYVNSNQLSLPLAEKPGLSPCESTRSRHSRVPARRGANKFQVGRIHLLKGKSRPGRWISCTLVPEAFYRALERFVAPPPLSPLPYPLVVRGASLSLSSRSTTLLTSSINFTETRELSSTLDTPLNFSLSLFCTRVKKGEKFAQGRWDV